ncbi:hypothetical protein JAAARDRAFT_196951 [Jaapia argillacea MUCL 33604]|uniref:Lysophospholipase n=1 Tax=Jaapia argillacea MUCL 33604 TaxID=933084 RepID=A0A067PU21_9AGAM|nr:hypothetical protein JAAARDRAFT_196951 [Jaapia argillacea MUCL 33604]
MFPRLFAFATLLLATVSPVLGQTAAQASTPQFAPCPSNFSLVRSAGVASVNQTLSPAEAEYVSAKKANVLPSAFQTYLTNVQGTNITLPSYVASILGSSNAANGSLPTVGLAISGGAYRAALFGAGILNALDARNSSSVQAGTGGLLQALTYISGLSGGSTIVYSLSQSNFPTMQDLILGPPNGTAVPGGWGGWTTAYGMLLQPVAGNDTTLNAMYESQLAAEIQGKYEAGFPVTLVDALGRNIARHFLNGTTTANFFDNTTSIHGAGQLFSSIQNVPTFVDHIQPFPIVIIDSWSPGPNITGNEIPPANIIYEFNAFEMGSYDPSLSAFAPIQYLGTTNESVCVTGFEQAGFVIGTSNDYFAGLNTSASAVMAGAGWPWIELVNGSYPQPEVSMDVAYYPNPFQGVKAGEFIDAGEAYLRLTDGGNDGEVIPLQPLLVKARGIDVIIAVDANGDTTEGWSEGTSMVNAQTRANMYPSDYPFPMVPTNTSTFVSEGLNLHPTFFGCDNASTPLIIYIADGGPAPGYPAVTNTTGDTFNETFAQAVLAQTFILATQGYPANTSESKDPEYPACLACAVVDRTRAREGIERSGVCSSCFARYCWNGTQVAVTTSSGIGGRSSMQSVLAMGGAALALSWAVLF